MFERDLVLKPLDEVLGKGDKRVRQKVLPVLDLFPRLTEDYLDEGEVPHFQLGEDGPKVPATETGFMALGKHVRIPGRFLAKADPIEKQWLLEHRTENSAPENLIRVFFSDEGILNVLKDSQSVIEIWELIEQIDMLPEDAIVLNYWADQVSFRLDLVEPFAEGPPLRDPHGNPVTYGLRLSQDRRANLTPQVQPIIYAPAWGAIMETPEPVLKIEGRRKPTDEVLVELRAEMNRAIERVKVTAKHYVEMFSEEAPGDLPIAIERIMAEGSASVRTVRDVALRYKDIEFEDRPTTQADLVNLVANYSAAISTRSPLGRTVEQTAGLIIQDRTNRCTSCNAPIGRAHE